jgi:predicted ATPase
VKSIRLKGFRSLQDTNHIQLKPLTVVVGANGSGKSTFLRTFPLLRQSSEANPKGPILFYGDYVDFGSFEEFISKKSKSRELSITFEFDFSGERWFYFGKYLSSNLPDKTAVVVETIITSGGKDKAPRICGINAEILGHLICIKIDENHFLRSLTINESDYSEFAADVFSFDDGVLVPKFYTRKSTAEDKESFRPITDRQTFSSELALPSRITQQLYSVLYRYEHGNTSKERILEFLFSIGCRQKIEMMDLLRNSNNSTQFWSKAVSDPSRKLSVQRDLDYIADTLILASFFELVERISNQIREFSTSVRYIAPLRATAERYYRQQNLSVREVDFRGDNLTMFIASLNYSDRLNIESWLNQNFGFKIIARSSGGHQELLIQHQSSNDTYNIADEGFGYSQVLPIIVQLWSMIFQDKNRGKNAAIAYVIEQPELHLHPRMQCTLIDAFCAAGKIAKANGIDIKIIIETHSESMINRIGRNIGRGKIPHDDVGISVFNKHGTEPHTDVITSHFDAEGYLHQWPYGFFEPKD